MPSKFELERMKNVLTKEILLAVFTSDNGSGYRPANLPLRGKKGSVFEVKELDFFPFFYMSQYKKCNHF